MATITSANSVLMLKIDNLFPVPVPIQGFSADDIFGTEAIESAETSMGVDGNLSAGFVNAAVKWNITLQADSLSNLVFDNLYIAQKQVQEVYKIQGVVVLPGLGTKWEMKNGFMTSYQPLPDAKKVLQPRRYQITWESVNPAAALV